MRSVRAAENRRIGIEISPNVRWPFQTVDAISSSSHSISSPDCCGNCKVSRSGGAIARRISGEDTRKATDPRRKGRRTGIGCGLARTTVWSSQAKTIRGAEIECGDGPTCGISAETQIRADSGACGETCAEGRQFLRRTKARRAAPAFRLPPGYPGRAEILGGAQRAVSESRGQAAGGPDRGPPHGLRQLRGEDPAGELWGRDGDGLGPRDL